VVNVLTAGGYRARLVSVRNSVIAAFSPSKRPGWQGYYFVGE
jgi:hypothetical protein